MISLDEGPLRFTVVRSTSREPKTMFTRITVDPKHALRTPAQDTGRSRRRYGCRRDVGGRSSRAPSRRRTGRCSRVANTGLTTEGLSNPAACQWLIHASPVPGWPKLAGDRHHDQVRPGDAVGAVADDNRRPLFLRPLAGERKPHQDDIAELKGHRRRRPRDCSRRRQNSERSRQWRRGSAPAPPRANG